MTSRSAGPGVGRGATQPLALVGPPARAARPSHQPRSRILAASPRTPSACCGGGLVPRLVAVAEQPRRRHVRQHLDALHLGEEHLADGLLAEAVEVEVEVHAVGLRRAAAIALLVLDVAGDADREQPAGTQHALHLGDGEPEVLVVLERRAAQDEVERVVLEHVLHVVRVAGDGGDDVVARHVDEIQAEPLGAIELREPQERLVAHHPAHLERALRPDAAPADQLVELLHDLGTHGREPTDFVEGNGFTPWCVAARRCVGELPWMRRHGLLAFAILTSISAGCGESASAGRPVGLAPRRDPTSSMSSPTTCRGTCCGTCHRCAGCSATG